MKLYILFNIMQEPVMFLRPKNEIDYPSANLIEMDTFFVKQLEAMNFDTWYDRDQMFGLGVDIIGVEESL